MKHYILHDYPKSGGAELMFFLQTHKIFPTEVTQFYAAQVILAAECLHTCGILDQ